MPQRATYSIEGTPFYIHWDGYPEGAADYFLNMVKASNKLTNPNSTVGRTPSGGMAEAFIRGNELAEFTDSHEVHRDTEFRYDLSDGIIKVYSMIRGFESEKHFLSTGEMSLEDFINKYSEEKVIKFEGTVYSRSCIKQRIQVCDNAILMVSNEHFVQRAKKKKDMYLELLHRL